MAEEEGGVDLPGVHGILMIVGWLILSDLAQTIAWWTSCQTGLCSYYFKKAQHGARLFLAHQMLNVAAVLLAIAGVVVIAVTEEAQGAMASAARHAIYGIALMVAAAVQIMMRMAYPETPKFRTFHRWFGRLIGLWAYFCAFTGYELADGPESDGYTTIYILFGFWYGLRLLIGAGWFAAHKLGWVKNDGSDANGKIELGIQP